ncbi:MAG TPA: HlyD family efflux transporter periplasmic adaptor subunit [Roseiflexaceae bacterium]|nr:HlyD family efflux transporter periplasmic adaptor subunit [Roseiflexaceae bacterium]
MKRSVLLLGSLAFLVGCAGAPTTQTSPTPTPKPAAAALDKPTYTVQRGTVVDQLQLSGRVGAVQQQDLSFTQDGHLKTLYVTRTSVITAGQLLAELDLGELPNQLRQAQVALEQAQLALERDKAKRVFDERRAQIDLEEARAQLADLRAPPKADDLAKAQAALQEAQANLDSTRSNASAAKTNAQIHLQQATNTLTQAQSRFATAQQNWQHVQDTGTDPIEPSKTENGKSKPNRLNGAQRQQYYDAFVQAQAELRSAEAAVVQAQIDYDTARQNEGPSIKQAEAALSVAQAQLDALNGGPSAADLAAARRAIQRAELAIEEAKQGADPELDKRVASAQLDVERIQSQLDAGQIHAPFDGKIASIDIRPGDAVQAYKAVISVMNESQLEVVVDFIGTEDATKIGVGQEVELNFARYKGKTVKGRVERLPSKLTNSGSTVNADTAFHLSYEDKSLDLDVGDLVQVLLTISRKDDALWLPPQAVRAFEGRRFVVIKDGDRQRRQDVKVGIISTDRIEIVEGVKEGDVIVGQ